MDRCTWTDVHVQIIWSSDHLIILEVRVVHPSKINWRLRCFEHNCFLFEDISWCLYIMLNRSIYLVRGCLEIQFRGCWLFKGKLKTEVCRAQLLPIIADLRMIFWSSDHLIIWSLIISSSDHLIILFKVNISSYPM